MSRAHQASISTPANTVDGLLSRRQLRRRIPVSDMTVWRWEQAGLFPRHISINGRNYWRQTEVEAWINGKASGKSERGDGPC